MLIITNIAKREPLFSVDPYACETVETLYAAQEHHPFFLYAWVIMPDDMHIVLRVRAPGSVSKMMNVFKGIVSQRIGLGPLWQRGFHMRILTGDIAPAIRYVHRNPVRAGLVDVPEDYPWSTASGKWGVSSFQ